MPVAHTMEPADPFDLPDWVGVGQVVWRSTASLGEHLVTGELTSAAERLPCDVLAGDLAYPAPVLEDPWRSAAHQAWRAGEVALGMRGDALTLVTPGSAVDVALTLEAVRRLARAVGAPTQRFTVALRL